MRIMPSKSILLFLLFNIMFLTRMHADLIPNLRMPDLGMASAPSPAPSDPGMASAPSPECPAPNPAPLNPGLVSAPNPSPLDPGVAPAPDSGPFDLGIGLPPTFAPLNLNCSSCPIDPFGLAACGILISGNIRPDTIGLCCTTLSSLSKEDASACLCHAIEINAVKIADYDITDAMNKALSACGKL